MSGKKAAASTIQSRLFWLASIVFFLSGATGLIYQVVWFRRFAHVWGSSSLAFAAVAASFLFGLGLGAYLFGRSADRAPVPLLWYGACEVMIGVLALLIPFEIAGLADASAGLYANLPAEPLWRYVVEFAITLVVVGPPCILMGGTLPLMIRQLTARDGSLDEATGWLYAINTFGAAVGCYLAGFHLLPALGLLWTNILAAAINLAIGLVALAASGTARRLTIGRAGHALEPPLGAPRRTGLYLAAALVGCAALVLEMTWTRQLALVLGSSTYALSATLFVVLLGIALGSLVFHGYLRPIASSPYLPVAVIGVIVLGTWGGLALLPSLSSWAGPQAVRDLRGDPVGNAAVCVGASLLLELVPAMGMGVLFPLMVHLTRATAAHVGAAVGNVYAANTLGAIAGASLTAVLLFPWIGTSGAAALAATMYVVALVPLMPWQGAAAWARGALALAGGAAAVAMIARPIDPRLTNMGQFLYGDRSPSASEGPATQLTPLFFREGASSNVLVTRHFPEHVSLRVNGKVDATNASDMVTQTGLAYFPRLFKPDAKEVFVIGFGSGTTSGRSLLFPDTRVTCCELEPAVYEAARYFAAVNGRPQEQTRAALAARNEALPADDRLSSEAIDAEARFSIVFGDGRTVLAGSPNQYDLIISEPSNPWVAGCSNLFTREFFQTAREHLTRDGVLAQWIQAYHFTADDYLMIVRTLRSEFPHYAVIELVPGADTLLLASNRPLLPDLHGLAEMQALIESIPEARADFDTWFGGTDLRLALVARYLLGQVYLERLVERNQPPLVNTDLDPRLEFDAPLKLFRRLSNEESVFYVLRQGGSDRWLVELARQLNFEPGTPEFFTQLGDCYYRQAEGMYTIDPVEMPLTALRQAAKAYQTALKLQGDYALAQRGLQRTKLRLDTETDREQVLRQLLALNPDDGLAHAQLASLLMGKKDIAQAVAHYREALRARPALLFTDRTYSWANNLAWILATNPDPAVRNGPEALHWAEQACAVAGNSDPSVIDTLAAALAEVGRFDEAIRESRRVLEMAPEQQELVESIKARIKLYELSQPFHEG